MERCAATNFTQNPADSTPLTVAKKPGRSACCRRGPVSGPACNTDFNYSHHRGLHAIRLSNFRDQAGLSERCYLWEDQDTGEYLIADYKSTAKKDPIAVDNVWPGYWSQLDFYQYLVRGRGYKVSSLGYLVYANGDKKRSSFDGTLHFDVSLISKECDDSWVDGAVIAAHAVLQSDEVPTANNECAYCQYRRA